MHIRGVVDSIIDRGEDDHTMAEVADTREVNRTMRKRRRSREAGITQGLNTAGEGCTDRPAIFVDGRVISPSDLLSQSREAW